MRLKHLHLPGLTSYTHAARLQDKVVSAFLAHKANPASAISPRPTIITAQFRPVYTCGRREVGTVSSAQRAFLAESTSYGKAEFQEALRGGQTTFHGPGQLIAYPVLDLRRHGLSPRCYVSLLEQTVIDLCAKYDVKAMRTEHPGVWVTEMDKLCALGVHLRRNITSHGIGLNVSTELAWFDRIVACGLEGKRTTSFAGLALQPLPSVDAVASAYVATMAAGLQGIDGVDSIDENELV